MDGWSSSSTMLLRARERPLGIRGRLTLTARLTDYSAPGSIGPAKRLKVILSSERLLGPTSVFLAPQPFLSLCLTTMGSARSLSSRAVSPCARVRVRRVSLSVDSSSRSRIATRAPRCIPPVCW